MSLLKPKKRMNKTNAKNQKNKQRSNVQKVENTKQYPLNVLDKNKIFDGNYFITCRSCFWYFPVNDYNRYNANGFYTICPLCASNNIETLSISTDTLFKYISININ
jgi:hypothetical protein